MNRYLERLRSVASSEGFEGMQGAGFSENQAPKQEPENFKTPIPPTPSKPSKPSSEGFEGARGTPFLKNLEALGARCPEYVAADRWQQCLHDGSQFLDEWGDKAEALGWTADDLFKLHTPPENPHSSYSRLSRLDHTGLAWILQGCRVTALSSTIAAITIRSGATLKFRKTSKQPDKRGNI